MKFYHYLIALLPFLFTHCDTSEPEPGRDSLINTQEIAAGEECANGGIRIESGLDQNRDGILGAQEVTQIVFNCNGQDGLISLVAFETLSPNSECLFGGNLIHSGVDKNANGELDSDEIDASTTICNGINGYNAIIDWEQVNEGSDCAYGGMMVTYGQDINYDNILQSDEATATVFLCNGEDGVSSLIDMEQLAPGEECSAGGLLIASGLDTNGNGTLDDSEVTKSEVICNLTGSADEEIIDNVASDSIIELLEDLGLQINRGTNPPNIENTYLISPVILIGSNRASDNIGSTYLDIKFQVSDQNNTDLTALITQQQAGGIGQAQGGFIIGENNRFTVLVDLITTYETEQDSARTLSAYSGEITESGIINYQYSLTLTDDYGDPNGRFIEIGDSRLFEDGDNFSEIIDENISENKANNSMPQLNELLISKDE